MTTEDLVLHDGWLLPYINNTNRTGWPSIKGELCDLFPAGLGLLGSDSELGLNSGTTSAFGKHE